MSEMNIGNFIVTIPSDWHIEYVDSVLNMLSPGTSDCKAPSFRIEDNGERYLIVAEQLEPAVLFGLDDDMSFSQLEVHLGEETGLGVQKVISSDNLKVLAYWYKNPLSLNPVTVFINNRGCWLTLLITSEDPIEWKHIADSDMLKIFFEAIVLFDSES